MAMVVIFLLLTLTGLTTLSGRRGADLSGCEAADRVVFGTSSQTVVAVTTANIPAREPDRIMATAINTAANIATYLNQFLIFD